MKKKAQRFVVGDKTQAGYLANQAPNTGQEQAGSIVGRQAQNQCWKVSHVAGHNLAERE